MQANGWEEEGGNRVLWASRMIGLLRKGLSSQRSGLEVGRALQSWLLCGPRACDRGGFSSRDLQDWKRIAILTDV